MTADVNHKSLRVDAPNVSQPIGPQPPLTSTGRVELTFDEGILVTCPGCGLSWRVEERRGAADWWQCPSQGRSERH
jgi:predicted RNA-binding Zn-ribbon protein involved in translation (DUF1610 family)